jgi:hypothetical protein
MPECSLPVELPDGRRTECRVEYWPAVWPESHVRITIGDREFHEHSRDYWHALREVRRRLESEGLRLVCNGTSKDVYTFGMCFDMGLGLLAYRLEYFRAKPNSVVNLFEASPWNRFSTVAEQRKRFERWRSLPQFLPARRS